MTNAPNNPKDGVTVLHPGAARGCATDAGEAQDTLVGEILDKTLENLGVDERCSLKGMQFL